MNEHARVLRVEEPLPEQQESGGRIRAGLLKFAVRADLIICFIVIPIGIFIGSLCGIKPITISLVGLAAVFVIACMRAVRNTG